MRARSTEDFLRELKERGARRLKKVRFRANRSTIWSLTQDATVLNVHVAYRRAPAGILDAFAAGVARVAGVSLIFAVASYLLFEYVLEE